MTERDHEHQWYQTEVRQYGDPYIAERCKFCGAWRCGYVPIAANRDITIEKIATKRTAASKRA